jgi:hypothetical protein
MAIIWNVAALISLSWSLPNDELALKKELSRLESSWSSLDSWLNFWTLMVVIGVAVELVVIVVEHRHAMHDFERGIMRPPDRPSRLLLALGLLGAGMVAIGVAGEFSVHIRAGRIETDMRDATVRLVGIAEGRASEANQKAGEANERASKNEKEAAGLRKVAEDERMARIQLAASISWRAPDRTLIPQLSPSLRRFAGQRYTIVSEFSDPERLNVFSWIGLLLGDAHWALEEPRSTSELTFLATNIVLWVSPNAPSGALEASRALVPVMERAGLSAVVLQSPLGPQPDTAPPELIRIVIFKKGPRMTVIGNSVTFEGLPAGLLFGSGPPH